MWTRLKKALKVESINYPELVKSGAKIIDVRTQNEFKQGHIPNSINIPLQQLAKKHSKLNRESTYILCCASGIRSRSAKTVLESKGFENVINGKSWVSLCRKL